MARTHNHKKEEECGKQCPVFWLDKEREQVWIPDTVIKGTIGSGTAGDEIK